MKLPLIQVNMRGEAVVADSEAEVVVEHPRRPGPQVGPVAVDTLIAELEDLYGAIEVHVV